MFYLKQGLKYTLIFLITGESGVYNVSIRTVNYFAFIKSSIIALPLDKDSPKSKISLNHTGMINLFNASHHDHVVASTCRHDSSIRIWDVFPKEDPQILESPKPLPQR